MGFFDLTINNMDGTAQALTTVGFTLTTQNPIPFGQLPLTVIDGSAIAAHMVVCSGAVQDCGDNATGFIGSTHSQLPIIPEPGSLALLGTALFGLGWAAWQRKRA